MSFSASTSNLLRRLSRKSDGKKSDAKSGKQPGAKPADDAEKGTGSQPLYTSKYNSFFALLQVPDVGETSRVLQQIFHGTNVIINDLSEETCEVFLAAEEGRVTTTIRFASLHPTSTRHASGYQGPEIRLCLHVGDLKPINDALNSLDFSHYVADHDSLRFFLQYVMTKNSLSLLLSVSLVSCRWRWMLTRILLSGYT